MNVELIPATEAEVSEVIPLPRNFNPGAVVTIGASGLTDAEAVYVWVRYTPTSGWEALKQWGQTEETLITVTATSGPVTLENPSMRFGVTKSASNYPVAVYAVTQDLKGRDGAAE